MSKKEMKAIQKLVSACNSITSSWGCDGISVAVDHKDGDYTVTIECPACCYAIFIGSFLSNIGSFMPHVNGSKVFIL